MIHCLEFDKYGRLLIEVMLPDSTEKLHEWLISNNYAKPYEGGTKEGWFKDSKEKMSKTTEEDEESNE